MKSLLLAAFVAAFATASLAAEPVDVPRHKCEPKPVLPGAALRRDAMVVKRFQRELDEYKNCMRAYADERSAAAKAHTEAGNAAINEYNETIKAIQEAQKAQ